jgi:N-sulfoglucosamine sulfohydrolase
MTAPNRPNILLIHAHDCGRAIEPYGWPVSTPHLLQFAREGVLFRKAYSTAPTCGPARTALMTGEYPHQSGMFGLPGRDGWEMRDPSHHLVHVLNANGYLTALAGVQHEVNHADLAPLQYQRLLDVRAQKGEHYPETLDKVEAFLQEPHDRPFFLSVGLDEPHRNNLARPEIGVGNESARFSKTRYYDPDKLDWRYTAPPPWLPDIPEMRKDTASFHEGVRILDEYIGRLLAMIRHRNLEQSTLVILTTDHGIEFTGGKKTLREQGTGVFLLLRGPGGFAGGTVVESLVSHLDLAPTILELCGIAPCPWHEGQSLLPLAANPSRSVRDCVFSEQNYHGNLEALRAVSTGRYRLVLHHDPIGYRMRHDGPTCPLMEEFGAYDQAIGLEALYDLYLDPMEACNRAHDPAYAAIKADLHARLQQWMLDTGDCFPSGQFPIKPALRSAPPVNH